MQKQLVRWLEVATEIPIHQAPSSHGAPPRGFGQSGRETRPGPDPPESSEAPLNQRLAWPVCDLGRCFLRSYLSTSAVLLPTVLAPFPPAGRPSRLAAGRPLGGTQPISIRRRCANALRHLHSGCCFMKALARLRSSSEGKVTVEGQQSAIQHSVPVKESAHP